MWDVDSALVLRANGMIPVFTLREKRDARASLASRPRRLGVLARARSTAGPGGQPPSTWSGERMSLSAATLDQGEVQFGQEGRDWRCHVSGCYCQRMRTSDGDCIGGSLGYVSVFESDKHIKDCHRKHHFRSDSETIQNRFRIVSEGVLNCF